MKNLLLTTLFIATSTLATTPDFSWYDLKDSIERQRGTISADNTPNKSTQQMIRDRYNVSTSKKSIKQIIEDQTNSSLAIGLEIQSNPSYTYDEYDPMAASMVTKSGSLSGTAIYIKGNLDFAPIGAGSIDLNAKVALSSTSVDFDISKRLIGTKYSAMSLDSGLGLKAVVKENVIFDKGFHGYASTSLNYLTDNYQFNAGIRALLSKPEKYDSGTDILSPFIGGGIRF